MGSNSSFGFKMRVIHRYLGFFLVGIMFVYSISGMILIFRDTDFLKKENHFEKQLKVNAAPQEIGELLKIKNLKIDKQEGDVMYFKNGTYDSASGKAAYTTKTLPTILEKMTHLHKAKTTDPLFFLNIFFGLSLLFFVVSSFWMYMPNTTIFKKGMYFTLGGIVLTLILLFI